MKRSRIGLTAGLAVAVLIAGCNSGGGDKPSKTLKELGKDEKASIKVLFWDKNYFFQQYGNLFSAKFPNIDVQVVSMQNILMSDKDPSEAFQKLVDEEKPDVLLFDSTDTFEKFANDGKLYQLDDVIRQDKFDIENILPNVVDLIKAKGNGNIYGLTPSFGSQALFYNKDLFEKHGVPLPKNKMTWNEALDLAKRFPKDGQGNNRIYGFAEYASYAFIGMNDKKQIAYEMMKGIGATSGLSLIDPDKGAVTIQSDGWKEALLATVEALKSGAVFDGGNEKSDPNKPMSMEEHMKKDLFATGRLAMTVGGPYMISSLQRTKDTLKDVTPVNWDIVTVPVDPKNPEVSNSVYLSGMFAVNANSSNPRAAWELVKYINSEDMAKLLTKSEDGSLLSRTAYAKEREGRSMEPFYMLKMSEHSLNKNFNKVSYEFFYTPFNELALNEIQSVMEGKKSADDALKTMQEKGQEFYIKAKQEQDAKNAKNAKEGKDQKPAEPAKN
ncbi:multiple sugar transport system substrate-binding protein [Paenibacillus tianmuensis]|uniref:Multiple sugar transport system substrate-binding protein n=1 Tax=Paenibacillus tianmuensis TaxID=624147 RepID=A0A1G4RC85_9BACL|nr:extracellular solute-binding protein [Paenibacillus tianmuensis]SCW54125.1 multiple sugar transport system substrate-binding protein [Paenibacillus tianmuensis]